MQEDGAEKLIEAIGIPMQSLTQMVTPVLGVANAMAGVVTVQAMGVAQTAAIGMRQLETGGAIGLLSAGILGAVSSNAGAAEAISALLSPLEELKNKAGEILTAVQAAGEKSVADKAEQALNIGNLAGSAMGVVGDDRSVKAIPKMFGGGVAKVIGKVAAVAGSPNVLLIIAAIGAVAAAVIVVGEILGKVFGGQKKETTAPAEQANETNTPAQSSGGQTGVAAAGTQNPIEVISANQAGQVASPAEVSSGQMGVEAGSVQTMAGQTGTGNRAAARAYPFGNERALLEEARQSERAMLTQQAPQIGETVFQNTLTVQKMVTEMDEEQLRQWFVNSIERERNTLPNGIY